MDRDDLISTTSRLGGFTSDMEAERAIEAVLETLGERLSEAAAVRLATSLPEAAATALLRRRVPASFSEAELFDRVGRRMGVDHGRAIEHVLVVCEALATLLPPEETERVHQAVTAQIAELFTRRSRQSTPHRHVHETREQDHTLAGGRLGSRRPLSEAKPDLAHADSVARSVEPHADTKLSSSHGLTQEREERSLATGRPGSRRPLSTNR